MDSMQIFVYTFDELSTKELYAIMKHRQEVFAVRDKIIFNDCDDKDFISHHVVGKIGDEIVAYLRILPYDENIMSFGRVSVKFEARGNDFGKQIVEFAVDYIKNQLKCDKIKIAAQEHVIGFYEKLGFSVVSERFYEVLVAHKYMIYTN